MKATAGIVDEQLSLWVEREKLLDEKMKGMRLMKDLRASLEYLHSFDIRTVSQRFTIDAQKQVVLGQMEVQNDIISSTGNIIRKITEQLDPVNKVMTIFYN